MDGYLLDRPCFCFWISVLVSSDKNPAVESLGHKVVLFLIFLRNLYNVAAPICNPANSAGGFPFLHIFSNAWDLFPWLIPTLSFTVCPAAQQRRSAPNHVRVTSRACSLGLHSECLSLPVFFPELRRTASVHCGVVLLPVALFQFLSLIIKIITNSVK